MTVNGDNAYESVSCGSTTGTSGLGAARALSRMPPKKAKPKVNKGGNNETSKHSQKKAIPKPNEAEKKAIIQSKYVLPEVVTHTWTSNK